MPSKSTKLGPKSKGLIPVDPRHVSSRVGPHGKRHERIERPTTARALVLRNGKYGARGTAELMIMRKLSGREKLDLLAEDLMEKSKKALTTPFRMEECLKIAESQCGAYLDDIANLHDPELFMHLIQAELTARTSTSKTQTETHTDKMSNPMFIAEIIATKIHNSYLLASAWKLVSDALTGLVEDGLQDGNVRAQLKRNEKLRAQYLVLYEMVNHLVDTNQSKFSILATTTPHYQCYFKEAENIDGHSGHPEIAFDWSALRAACLSFLDSIVIELCFPRAPYPQVILYQILKDAVEEAPREASRFPQALWDATGDLSVSVELRELLEVPLTGADGQTWKDAPRRMPEQFEDWLDAQIYSEKASRDYAKFKDLIFPLEKTKQKGVLDNMWKYVNLNYKVASGEDIDTLWGLTEVLKPSPQWHAFYMPGMWSLQEDFPPPLSGKGDRRPKRLTIADRPASDSENSMPDLQSISNSSDDSGGDSSDDSDDNINVSDDKGSGYDTEEEDEMREMLREAMDFAHEADWLHSAGAPQDMDPFQDEDRKGNPFLKLLTSLKGRIFSANPRLQTSNRQEPLKPKFARAAAASTSASVTESRTVVVEEAEDEEATPRTPKKKKYKKKRKTAASAPSKSPSPHPQSSGGQAEENITIEFVNGSALSSSSKGPAAAVQKPKATNVANLPQDSASTLSLPVETTTAQSARSYLRESAGEQKSKVKTRPDYATSFTSLRSDKNGRKGFGLLSKLKRRGKDEEIDSEKAKGSWFANLGKKTFGLMHQLLNGSASGNTHMKWEDFLKIMREMGFSYDPCTAGSSVRFDPPDPRDPSITFHKPHPDSDIQPYILRGFAKRLRDKYGWTEDDLLRHGL